MKPTCAQPDKSGEASCGPSEEGLSVTFVLAVLYSMWDLSFPTRN